MKKTLSVEEIKVLIMRAMEVGEINLQQQSSEDSPSFALNVRVSKCVQIHNGIQFHLNDGYINLEFQDNWKIKEGLIEHQSYELDFQYDHDKPKGYFVNIGGSRLFFYGNEIENILNNIEEEVKDQREKDEREHELRVEANRNIPSEVWVSVDNMMEK